MATPDQSLNEPHARGEHIESGTVRAVGHGRIAVDLGDGPVVARRAASCLIAPQPGDQVLCAYTARGAFVLAVLERESRDAVLDVEGDLSIRTGGTLDLDAEGDVTVSATRSLRLKSAAITSLAEHVTTMAKSARTLAEEIRFEGTRIHQSSTFAERVAGSLRERFERSYRDVEEGEHVRAGALTWSVRSMLRCHAANAVFRAQKLMKLDGDQIHLG